MSAVSTKLMPSLQGCVDDADGSRRGRGCPTATDIMGPEAVGAHLDAGAAEGAVAHDVHCAQSYCVDSFMSSHCLRS